MILQVDVSHCVTNDPCKSSGKNWRFAPLSGAHLGPGTLCAFFLSAALMWCSGQGKTKLWAESVETMFQRCFLRIWFFIWSCIMVDHEFISLYNARGIYWVRKTPGILSYGVVKSNHHAPIQEPSKTKPPNAKCPPRNNASLWLSHILFIHHHNPLMIPLIRPGYFLGKFVAYGGQSTHTTLRFSLEKNKCSVFFFDLKFELMVKLVVWIPRIPLWKGLLHNSQPLDLTIFRPTKCFFLRFSHRGRS